MSGDALPRWMLELAEQVRRVEPDCGELSRTGTLLPTGVIVGAATISRCTHGGDTQPWRLAAYAKSYAVFCRDSRG